MKSGNLYNMIMENSEIVEALLEYEKTGSMNIEAFIALNTMDIERKKEIFQLRDFARFLNKDDLLSS